MNGLMLLLWERVPERKMGSALLHLLTVFLSFPSPPLFLLLPILLFLPQTVDFVLSRNVKLSIFGLSPLRYCHRSQKWPKKEPENYLYYFGEEDIAMLSE
jgi:hypothetical protein